MKWRYGDVMLVLRYGGYGCGYFIWAMGIWLVCGMTRNSLKERIYIQGNIIIF